MSLVRLEFLTDDENLIQLCTHYWQVDQEGNFACKVADLARNFGLSTNELGKRVKNSCKALSTANFCDECKAAYVYSSRTDIQNLLRNTTFRWLCEDCTKRKVAREKAEQAALIVQKRKLVQQNFSLDLVEEIDAKTLALEDIVYLINFVRLGASEDFSFIRPLGSITDLLSPRKHFDYDILKRLYRRALIFVHPNSGTVVGAIQRQAERALSEEWEVKAYRRDFRCPQSMISQVLFNTALQMGDIGFTQPPRIGAISKFSSNMADAG